MEFIIKGKTLNLPFTEPLSITSTGGKIYDIGILTIKNVQIPAIVKVFDLELEVCNVFNDQIKTRKSDTKIKSYVKSYFQEVRSYTKVPDNLVNLPLMIDYGYNELDKYIYIVYEKLSGDLTTFNGKFASIQDKFMFLATDILNSIHKLGKNNIVYNNVNPYNIMWKDDKIFFIDFQKATLNNSNMKIGIISTVLEPVNVIPGDLFISLNISTQGIPSFLDDYESCLYLFSYLLGYQIHQDRTQISNLHPYISEAIMFIRRNQPQLVDDFNIDDLHANCFNVISQMIVDTLANGNAINYKVEEEIKKITSLELDQTSNMLYTDITNRWLQYDPNNANITQLVRETVEYIKNNVTYANQHEILNFLKYSFRN